MNQELISKINKYNPKWSSRIIDFLAGNVEYPVSTEKLDINVLDTCIVGEVYGFSPVYDDDFDESQDQSCKNCSNFGMALWRNASVNWKDEFERLLTLFYEHVESEHSELIE